MPHVQLTLFYILAKVAPGQHSFSDFVSYKQNTHEDIFKKEVRRRKKDFRTKDYSLPNTQFSWLRKLTMVCLVLRSLTKWARTEDAKGAAWCPACKSTGAQTQQGSVISLTSFLTPEIVYINDGEPARPKANRRVTQSLVIV